MARNDVGVRTEPGQPIVLALDSAGSGCSVVVGAGETVLAAERCATARGQAEMLLPLVDVVMRRSGLSRLALDIVGATVGPGSFTGIRVGLATALGIALATGVRPVGVTSFEAVAAGLSREVREWGASFLLVALESRREELYIQLFDHASCPAGDPMGALPAALGETLKGLIGEAPLIVGGDAAQRAASMLLPRADTIVTKGSAPDAAGLLRAVLGRASRREGSLKPSPVYLRPPDVTVSSAYQRAMR